MIIWLAQILFYLWPFCYQKNTVFCQTGIKFHGHMEGDVISPFPNILQKFKIDLAWDLGIACLFICLLGRSAFGFSLSVWTARTESEIKMVAFIPLRKDDSTLTTPVHWLRFWEADWKNCVCVNETVCHSEFLEVKICFSLKVDSCFEHGSKWWSWHTESE